MQDSHLHLQVLAQLRTYGTTRALPEKLCGKSRTTPLAETGCGVTLSSLLFYQAAMTPISRRDGEQHSVETSGHDTEVPSATDAGQPVRATTTPLQHFLIAVKRLEKSRERHAEGWDITAWYCSTPKAWASTRYDDDTNIKISPCS